MTVTRPVPADVQSLPLEARRCYEEFWECLIGRDFDRLAALFDPRFEFILDGEEVGGTTEFLAMVRRWTIAFPNIGEQRYEQFAVASSDGTVLTVGEVLTASTGLRPMVLPALFCLAADLGHIAIWACYFPHHSPLGGGNSRYPREQPVERKFREVRQTTDQSE